MAYAKGDHLHHVGATVRLGGVDYPAIHTVTSVRAGRVYLRPAWPVPVDNWAKPIFVPTEVLTSRYTPYRHFALWCRP